MTSTHRPRRLLAVAAVTLLAAGGVRDRRVRPRRAHLLLARPAARHQRHAGRRRGAAEGAQPRLRAPAESQARPQGEGSLQGRAHLPAAQGRRQGSRRLPAALAADREARDPPRPPQGLPRPADGGPAQAHRQAGQRYRRYNRTLFRLCGFREIQPAVTASRNNDRVVVMPGVYTEPTARKVPDLPGRSASRTGPRPRRARARSSYEYQFRCPNAQALVAVIGRALGPGRTRRARRPAARPRTGSRTSGACIRCNFQIEGSGAGARRHRHRRRARRVRRRRRRAAPRRTSAIKADRADGFVAQGHDGPPRRRARRLRARDRRLPARARPASCTAASTGR